MSTQTSVKDLLNALQSRGWTIAAIARQLEMPYRTVQDWHLGNREAVHAASVRRDLERLLTLKVPKRRKV